MSRRKTIDSKKEFTVRDAVEQELTPAITSAKKVTLVKPAQLEESAKETADGSSIGLLSARPKIGNFQAASLSKVHESISEETSSQPENILTFNMLGSEARSWDSKFALFLVALLVMINLGLVILLHNDKPASQLVEQVPAQQEERVGDTAPVAIKAETPAVVSEAPQEAVAKENISPTHPSVEQPVVVSPVSAPAPSPAAKQQLLSIIGKD